MLIVEELFLLLTDANGNPVVVGTSRTTALNAALLADLHLARRIQLSEDERPRVRVAYAGHGGNDALGFGQEMLSKRTGRRLADLIWWGRLDPEEAVVNSLVRSGILRRVEERGWLGRSKVKLLKLDPTPERELRERLAAVFAGRSAPTPADATILAILESLDVIVQLLYRESGASSRPELRARLAQVLDHSSAPDYAVSRTVRGMRLDTSRPSGLETGGVGDAGGAFA
ncbi:MAG: GPP34 family phosphoprotein [Microlunatus sp.]